LLIGQGVEPKQRAAMVAFLEARPEIDTVYNVLTLQMGTDVMVAIKAKMAAAPTARAMIEAINVVEADFKAEFRDVRWSFFEPDYTD
jgi:divalent metal cation (Fe/Co/Zn/Cd) transporter